MVCGINLMGTLRLLARCLALKVVQTISFRMPLVMELVWGGGYTAAMFAFWQVIYARVPGIAGWQAGQMMIFMGFTELFWGLSRGIFGIARGFWYLIHTGQLDVHLCRPVEPRIISIVRNMEPTVLLRGLVFSTFWLIVALRMGVHLDPRQMCAAIIVALLGCGVYVEFSLTVNYLGFVWGQASALEETVGGFWELLRYPLNLFPTLVQRGLIALLPAFLAATAPAMVALGKVAALPTMGTALGVAVLWHLIQQRAWKAGLHHYESCGG